MVRVRVWFILFLLAALAAIALFALQVNKQFLCLVVDQYRHLFESSFDCSIQGQPVQLNLLAPSLTLADVTVKPKKGDAWQWYAKKLVTSSSWWHLLRYGLINLQISVDDLQAQSHLSGDHVPIVDHVKDLIFGAPSSVPLCIDNISLNNASCYFNDPDGNLEGFLSWHCLVKRVNQLLRTKVQLRDCWLKKDGVSLLENLSGVAKVDVGDVGCVPDITIEVDGACALPRLATDRKDCFFSGTWTRDRGHCALKQCDNLFFTDPITIRKKVKGYSIEGGAHADLAALAPYLASEDMAISGHVDLQSRCNVDEDSLEVSGSCRFDNVRCTGLPLTCCGALTYMRDDKGLWRLSGTVVPDYVGPCLVSASFDEQTRVVRAKSATTKVHTAPFGGWRVDPGRAQISVVMGANKNLSGVYAVHVVDEKTGNVYQIHGAGRYDQLGITIEGNVHNYLFTCTTDQELENLHAELVDHDNCTLVVTDLMSMQNGVIQSEVQVDFIKNLLKRCADVTLQGHGICNLQIVLDREHPQVSLRMADGSIRLPHTYNIVTSLACDLIGDVKSKKIIVPTLFCALQRGSLEAKNCRIGFTDTYALSELYLPLVIKQCLLTAQKDLCALVSGSVLAQYDGGDIPHLSGNLVIEYAQLQENLFSTKFQQQLMQSPASFTWKGFDVACDLHVKTKDAVAVQTPFLDARAAIDMRIQQTLRSPLVTGSISVRSGALAFPYKSLYITKGSLLFMPENLYDPLIEIEAKNKIRKYGITMRATGSLQSPQVTFEAVPQLTDEQIIALLLVGSEQASLNIVAPALVVDNVAQLVFDSGDATKQLKQFMKALTPFDRVRIVPSFTDQTGRGGLRAGIEIDINDRWHASVQKNFSLTEDTRFELDYQLSDEVSVRAFRDERKDVGGEIEMRWKF